MQRDKILDDEVGAANLAAFDPGYIISDWQMSNYTSMNESEIQAFLKSKNSCNDANLGKYTAGEKVSYFSEMSPPRTWHIKDGHFVCMADEEFEGGTAAHIIYKAAQDYKINPQVLLVLLEKEQSLVRDTFPHSQQYRSATGYGCPDTATCSSKYYGLQNQIRNAAALFRTVLDGGWTNYPLGNNYVQYNPSAACGGSVVNIKNLATSALYRYTPYQPNGVTLAGGSDGCSAYGNLNFYRYFEDWFGGIREEEKVQEVAVEAKAISSRTIADGVYQIVSKAYPDKALDIKGGIYAGMDSALLQVYAKKDQDKSNQLFQISFDENKGYYKIINPISGFAVDVKGAKIANSTHTQVYSVNSNCNQDWLFNEDIDGYYTIVSRCSSKALDVGATTKLVNIFDYHGGDNQKWKLIKVSDEPIVETGNYQIVSKLYSNKTIDIKGGIKSGMSQALLQVYTIKKKDMANQIFRIEYDKDSGYYNIINPTLGMSVDIKGAKPDNSTHTQVFSNHGRCNQKWFFEKDADGFYVITSKCTGKVLDVGATTKLVNIFD